LKAVAPSQRFLVEDMTRPRQDRPERSGTSLRLGRARAVRLAARSHLQDR